MTTIPFSALNTNYVTHLPEMRFSEEEIITFAHLTDPQPIHIDKAAAAKSRFGGIIASGSHAYLEAHKRYWMPLTTNTFVCGMGIDKWQFLLPIYPNMPIFTRLSIKETMLSESRKNISVVWFFEFLDEEKALIQSLEVKVLHENRG